MGMTIEERIAQLVRVKHYASPRHYETLDVAINTMRKYQMMQADYNARLKADMVAMLEEIDLEFEELTMNTCEFDVGLGYRNIIQQKIDKLKGVEK